MSIERGIDLDANVGIELIDQITNDYHLHELRAMAVNRSVMSRMPRKQMEAEEWIDRIDARLQQLRKERGNA